jgi:hypothetical protein
MTTSTLDRGRAGGRINLIDAAVAVLILVLIPMAYGAYLLFRTPPAKLTTVYPATLYQGPDMRVEVVGENLRPFMRVSFGTVQGRTFEIGGPRGALVAVPDLPPGVYDVVLYDYMQEVSRLPKALTVLPLAPTPSVELEVTGMFKGMSSDRIKSLKAGDRFPPSGDAVAEVLSVGGTSPSEVSLHAGDATLRVPVRGQTDLAAVLRVKCSVVSAAGGSLKCSFTGSTQPADVAPGSALSLATSNGWAMFQIDQVRTPSPTR